jgi:hypothetical protein
MTGCFLLHRPIARRPTLAGRSAARGISTGVTSRGTPSRTRQVGQPVFSQVARRIEIPIHLQPARLTVKHPLGKGERRTDPAAARAPLRGREVPRRNEEHGPIPGALILQHPPEGSPSHIQNGPRETPVPRQAPHVQVLHHQNRLGFRQLGGDLVQEVLANVADAAMQPGQAQHGLRVVAGENCSLSLLPCLRIPLYYPPLGRWSPRGCVPSQTEGAPGVYPSAPWCGPCRCEGAARAGA